MTNPFRLRTFIAPASHASNLVSENISQIFWLDQLLQGGLRLPSPDVGPNTPGEKRPIEPPFVLLLSGPPGSGKTTFALQLCYNVACNPQPDWGADDDLSTARSLYISTESRTSHIIENASSFGWDTDERVIPYDKGEPIRSGTCSVLGNEQLETLNNEYHFSGFVSDLKNIWNDHLREPRSNPEQPLKPGSLPPEVVVVDSLNIFQTDPSYHFMRLEGVAQSPKTPTAPDPHSPVGEQFHELLRLFLTSGRCPSLLVVILDSEHENHHPFWEFLADAIFCLDYHIGAENYFTRSFQILKIKNQEHVLGKQVLKIISQEKVGEASGQKKAEGGAFIYPSVHWYLDRGSVFGTGASRTDSYRSGVEGLENVLSQGFPPQHTTALVGDRGAMKGHLAYTFLLHHALGLDGTDTKSKNVLLISLRDDEELARHTLATILSQQQVAANDARALEIVRDLEKTDRLQILYNAPGCITPEELFHKIFVAMIRKRQNRAMTVRDKEVSTPDRETAEIVVLNGLDHLEAKFPLCAAERVFVPALITLFRNFQLCSIVISGSEHGSATLASIGPLADLVLSFSDLSGNTEAAVGRTNLRIPDDAIQSALITAVRVPAGQIGGRRGILSRNENGRLRVTTLKSRVNRHRASRLLDWLFGGPKKV